MKYLSALFLVMVAASFGCGRSAPESNKTFTTVSDTMANVEVHKKALVGKFGLGPGEQVAMANQENKAGPADGGEAKPATPRKIKYTADISLIVEEFAKADEQLNELVEKHKGYIAKSDISASSGSIRTGSWRLRVPLDQFGPFCKALVKIGDVEKNSRDSEDVTETYYDLDNHIKNRLAELDSLRKLLTQTNDRMENILTIRKEINLVQDDVNRKQGQLRVLANLTDLTTVNLIMREKQKFIPEKLAEQAETPTFAARAGKTFEDSLGVLQSFGQGIALVLIGLAPWLPVLALVALPTWIVVRRLTRKRPMPVAIMDSPQGP